MKQQFIVRSAVNPALVLCTDGEYHAQGIHTGPGGMGNQDLQDKAR